MINAGAIATSSLVEGASDEARLARVVGALSAYAGRPLDVDQAVFESERETGHRNRAIGHLLRNYGIISQDPEPALEFVFQAVLGARRLPRSGADRLPLWRMAASNPVTGLRAVRAEFIRPILT